MKKLFKARTKHPAALFLLLLALAAIFAVAPALAAAPAADITFAEAFLDANFRQATLALLNADGGARTPASLLGAGDQLKLAAEDVLDVSFGNIGDLSGLEYFSGLSSLNCANNRLTELNITKNKNLKNLACYNNYLVSPLSVLGWQSLGLEINSPHSLESGDFCYYNQLTPQTSCIILTSIPPKGYIYMQDDIVTDSCTFTVGARVLPEGEPIYSWYQSKDGKIDPKTDTPIGTGPSLTVPNEFSPVTFPGPYYYYCYISTEDELYTAIVPAIAEVFMAVSDPGVYFTLQPPSLTYVTEGAITDSLITEAISGGNGTVRYSWYSNSQPVAEGGTLIEGATTPELTLPTDLTAAGSPYYFYCEADNAFMYEASQVATVIVLAAAPPLTFAEAFPDDRFLTAVLDILNENDGGARNPASLLGEADQAFLAAQTELRISYRNIVDLRGIEYFSGLLLLDCAGNRLQSLDVAQNSALTELYCHYNEQLSQLAVAKNAALEKLRCHNCTLTELDVTYNSALLSLICSGNLLSTLDLTHNGALTELNCAINALSSLDLSHNSALTILECWNNPLTGLNVTQNPALTSLICGNMDIENNWSSLDLSQNPALITLECWGVNLPYLDVSHNPALLKLHCGGNKLTTLDTSHNTLLTTLLCGDNLLTQLDFSSNSALSELYCGGNLLQQLNISHNAALVLLSCANNRLSSVDVSHNPVLAYLWCGDNQLTALDVSALPQLIQLYCWNNLLSTLDVSQNPNLEWLYCEDNYLQQLDVSHNTKLSRLYVNDNYFSSPDDVHGWQDLELEINTVQYPYVGTFRYYNQLISLSGAVLYQTSSRPATVELYDSFGIPIAAAATAADGTYTLSAPAGDGYTLKVSKPGYLSVTVRNLPLTSGEAVETIDLRQLAGDIDGNGVVNATDLTYLLSEFNRDPAASNYPYADIDGNGIVNATDLTYLLAGFNKHDVNSN